MSQFPKVNCKYGAPMGRSEYGTPESKAKLFKVVLSQGYDDGGAYWGMRKRGESLYCLQSFAEWQEDTQTDSEPSLHFYDAVNRRDAYLQALDDFPYLVLKQPENDKRYSIHKGYNSNCTGYYVYFCDEIADYYLYETLSEAQHGLNNLRIERNKANAK